MSIFEEYNDLTIIIPTLNEEDSINVLLSKLEEYVPNAKIIIADDGSSDKTQEIVTNFKGTLKIFFLDRKKEDSKGLTASILHAIDFVETPHFIVMDGDLQHPPERVKDFYTALKSGNNLVVGNRIKVVDEWPIHRKLMSKIATILGRISLFFRNKKTAKDIMSGFFGSKTVLWQTLIVTKKSEFNPKGYKILFDFLKLNEAQLKIDNINYVFGSRNFGDSKISKKVIWEYVKSLF